MCILIAHFLWATLWPSAWRLPATALLVIVALATPIASLPVFKVSVLNSADYVEHLDVRFTFDAEDAFDTLVLRYDTQGACSDAKSLQFELLEFSGLVFVTSTGQTLTPTSIIKPVSLTDDVIVSMTYPRSQTANLAGSGLISGIRGPTPSPAITGYQSYFQTTMSSYYYNVQMQDMLGLCLAFEPRLGQYRYPVYDPTVYLHARHLFAGYYSRANDLRWEFRVPALHPTQPLLLPTSVLLRFSPHTARVMINYPFTLSVVKQGRDDTPFLDSYSNYMGSDGAVLLDLVRVTADPAPFMTAIMTLHFTTTMQALFALSAGARQDGGITVTLTYPGGFSSAYQIVYPLALSPGEVPPGSISSRTVPDGAILTQISLPTSDAYPTFATGLCRIGVASVVSPGDGARVDVDLRGFPSFLRIGLSADLSTVLRICEARASSVGSPPSLLELFSADPASPDSCSLRGKAAAQPMNALREATAAPAEKPACVLLRLPEGWFPGTTSPEPVKSEFDIRVQITCVLANSTGVALTPFAGVSGSVTVELMQGERVLALQQTCAIEPAVPVRFLGPRAQVMFSQRRDDGSMLLMVTAATTRVRTSAVSRLAVRISSRDPAAPDIDANRGLDLLLGRLAGSDCTFTQKADIEETGVATASSSAVSQWSGTYTAATGLLLPLDADVVEGVPWTLSCNFTLPSVYLNMMLPLGAVDNVAIELLRCTATQCDGEPVAVSRPASESGRDTDSFAGAEWEANPVRVALLAGTGPLPLAASIVRNRRNLTRGSINVPFTFVAERHLEEHPAQSIAITVNMLNVFVRGHTPRCVLMDPLGVAAEAYVPHGSYSISYVSDWDETDRLRLAIAGFPPTRVNALIVLTCTGEIHTPDNVLTARSAIVEATVTITGVHPVVVSLSHTGINVQDHTTAPVPQDEELTLGYSRYGAVFARPEIDARVAPFDAITVDSALASPGLNLVMVLLSPRVPTFHLTFTGGHAESLDAVGSTLDMCRVHTMSFVSWNGANAPVSHIYNAAFRDLFHDSSTQTQLRLEAETAELPHEGGAIILRCADTTRPLLRTAWNGHPWRRTSSSWALHFMPFNMISGQRLGTSLFRFAAEFLLPPPNHTVVYDTFFLEPFTFHVPAAALAYDTAVSYAASHPWPPLGRYVTRFPNLSVQLLRRLLPYAAVTAASAVFFPGEVIPVTHRVTVVISNAAMMTLGGSGGQSPWSNRWAPTGSTLAQLGILLERRAPLPAGADAPTDATIDRKSVRVTCVAPATAYAVYNVTVRDFYYADPSFSAADKRSGTYENVRAGMTVQIGYGFSTTRRLGDCASAHVSFTVYSLPLSAAGGAYDTLWRSRVFLNTHFDYTALSDEKMTARTPSYVYQFAESVPAVSADARAPLGALYTSDSLRTSKSAPSAVIDNGVNTLLTFDVLGLNTTGELAVSLYVLPYFTLAPEKCTAVAYHADRAPMSPQTLVITAASAAPGPLNIRLNLTIAAFAPSPVPALAAIYSHSVRLQCPYTFGDTALLLRPRAAVPAVLVFTTPTWSTPQLRTLLLPPLSSRHLRVLSVHTAATVSAWPPAQWTDYRVGHTIWLDVRLLNEAGGAEDNDITMPLRYLRFALRGISFSPMSAGFSSNQFRPTRDVRAGSVFAQLSMSIYRVDPTIFDVLGLRTFLPDELSKSLDRALVPTELFSSLFTFRDDGGLIYPRLALSDADMPANFSVSCGAFDCGVLSAFRLSNTTGLPCGALEAVDANIALVPTATPLLGPFTEETAAAFTAGLAGPFPHGSTTLYYCLSAETEPRGRVSCVNGSWSRIVLNPFDSATCPAPAATLCDPFRSVNSATIADAGAQLPAESAPLSVGEFLVAPCRTGFTSPAGVSEFVCEETRALSLRPGSRVCSRIVCPAVESSDPFTTISFSDARNSAETDDGSIAEGYFAGTVMTLTCARGSALIVAGAERSLLEATCEEGSSAWAAVAALLPCTLSAETCLFDADPPHGSVSVSAADGLVAATYACDAGYEFEEGHRAVTITRRCTGDGPGGWDARTPVCIAAPTCDTASLPLRFFADPALFPATVSPRPTGVTITAGPPYDDSFSTMCPTGGVCDPPAPGPGPADDFTGPRVPLGVIATPSCAAAAGPRVVMPWPAESVMSSDPAPGLRVLRCVRARDPASGNFTAAWSTAAAAAATAAAGSTTLPPGLQLACLESPDVVSAAVNLAQTRVTVSFTLATANPTRAADFNGSDNGLDGGGVSRFQAMSVSRSGFAPLAVDSVALSTPSAEMCAALVTPAFLAAVGGTGAQCWWSDDGTQLFIAPGPSAATDLTAEPLGLLPGTIAPAPAAYDALFTVGGMTALSAADLASAALSASGAITARIVPEAALETLLLAVTHSSTVHVAESFRATVTALSGGALRPLSVAYELVPGAPGTVTTAGDAAVFADAITAHLAQWQPPGAAGDAYDGRSEAVTVLSSTMALLTPGVHQLRVEASTWLLPFGAVPAVEIRQFTVTTVPGPRARIAAAGARSEAPHAGTGLFDPGQQLIVTAEASPAEAEAYWSLTPDPGITGISGDGGSAVRNLIFPASFFTARNTYTLALRVVLRALSGDTEVTAVITLEAQSFPLVASVAAENKAVLPGSIGASLPTVTQRLAPVLLTPALAQGLVSNSQLPEIVTLPLDALAALVPDPAAPALVLDAASSYDPDEPRDSLDRAATITGWTCHRVLRVAPASGIGAPSYQTRQCSQVAPAAGALFASTAPQLALSRALTTALGPDVTDGSQRVTLVVTLTVRARLVSDPRRSQATLAIGVPARLTPSVSITYVSPQTGAVGASTATALATRLGLSTGDQTWAAAPLDVPLRLRAAVTAGDRLWALRWVCDDCGSTTDSGPQPAPVAPLDLAGSAVLTGVSSDVLLIAAGALSPSARYTFRVGFFTLPPGSPSFPASVPPPLLLPADGSDPLAAANVTASFAVYTPSAPHSGYCSYEAYGAASENGGHNVLVFCRGWLDTDEAAPFKYRWGYSTYASENPMDVLLAVTEGAAATAAELRLSLSPGTHSLSVTIINRVGGSTRFDLPTVAVSTTPGTDPLSTAQYHVNAAADALARLDATAFVAAVASASLCVRAAPGTPATTAAAQFASVFTTVSGYVLQQETLWLLTALENYERTVHATGDDTFVIAYRNVSTLTAVELLAVVPATGLSNFTSLTPGATDDGTAAVLLAALTPAASAAVTAAQALSASLARSVMTNLVEQAVPVTLSSGFAVASIVTTYAAVKTHSTPPSAGGASPSAARVLDDTLAPTAAALLLEAAAGQAPVSIEASGLEYYFGRVDGRAPEPMDPDGWFVRPGTLGRAAFPYANIGFGGASPPPDASEDPAFWLPSEALSDALSAAAAPLPWQPQYGVDIALVSRRGLTRALAGDAQHQSTWPPSNAVWTNGTQQQQQPRGFMSTAAGLTLGRPGTPQGVTTVLPVAVPVQYNSSAPAPPDTATDPELVWVSVPHEPAPAPLLGFFPYVAECRFFDVAAQAWSSQGCAVAASSNTRTWCKCAHLTVFSVRWSPGFLWPSFVSITEGTFGLLTGSNIAQYPAPVSTVSSMVLLGIVLCVAFFFIDVRFDQQGLGELLESWSPLTQQKTSLYKEFGLTPESSTAAFVWRRYLYVLQRDHLWASLLFRPRTDNYSSQARAFAVVFMMLLTLVISGALFRTQRQDAVLLTSIISAIVVYPAVIIWHVLFDHCNRDRLKRFVYRYAEEAAYLQLTGTSDFFPRGDWDAILARRRREVDEAADLIADAGEWRVSPDDVYVAVAPASLWATPVAVSPYEAIGRSDGTLMPPPLGAAAQGKPTDSFSLAASTAVASALQRGYIVRQRPDPRVTCTGLISNMSCSYFCMRGDRVERRRMLHRVSPLVPLNHSHPSLQKADSLSGSKPTAAVAAVAYDDASRSGSASATAATPASAVTIARAQLVSLIALASAGLTPKDSGADPDLASPVTASEAEHRRALFAAALSALASHVDEPSDFGASFTDSAADHTTQSNASTKLAASSSSASGTIRVLRAAASHAHSLPSGGSDSVTYTGGDGDDGGSDIEAPPLVAARLASKPSSSVHSAPPSVTFAPPPATATAAAAPVPVPTFSPTPSSLSALLLSTRSASRVSLRLADLSERLSLVRVPYDRETRRMRDRERLHFLLRYSVDLDTPHVEHVYRERAWEIAQPRGLRFLAVLVIALGVAVCVLMVLLIGLELDLGVDAGTATDARRVSERWVLSALLSIAIYVVVSSPVTTFVRSTLAYIVKGCVKGRSRPASASAIVPLNPTATAQAYRRPPPTEDPRARAYDDCGDRRFDGMPRPAASRRFSFVDDHANFFRARPTASTPASSAPSSRSGSGSSGSGGKPGSQVGSRTSSGGASSSGRRTGGGGSSVAGGAQRRGCTDPSDDHDGVVSGQDSRGCTPSQTQSRAYDPRLYIDPVLGLEGLDGDGIDDVHDGDDDSGLQIPQSLPPLPQPPAVATFLTLGRHVVTTR